MDTIVSLEEIKTRIRNILQNDLDARIDVDQINDDISFYEDGLGLDSISVVNLIVLIEKKFVISFDEDDLNYELFGSLNHLSRVISLKLNQ